MASIKNFSSFFRFAAKNHPNLSANFLADNSRFLRRQFIG
jgi:hypothetical protein